MTTVDQPRVPAGDPNGGRFAAVIRPESPIELSGPHAGGTYKFPPRIVDVDELLAFWTSVPISDEDCETFCANYKEYRDRQAGAASARYGEANPYPQAEKPSKKYADGVSPQVAEARRIWKEGRDLAVTEERKKDRTIYDVAARDLCRLRGLWENTWALSPDDRELLSRQMFVIGDGTQATLADFASRYEFENFGIAYNVKKRRAEEEAQRLARETAAATKDAAFWTKDSASYLGAINTNQVSQMNPY
ncbi:hypothetical protein ATK17_1728 [Branchiibius hedensis]|uniref:Uncharacterized protein n=1 Tax=Branchiibius hedensis TaxID=672460 RepID=A0A2Y8ZVX2_9MICO|nr:hypothetical protein ATK17_1728 [Branchiibius hedensis]SSA34409.1 hypothetical protein SAMN04489750_1728 [Branchiibius hedensis]